MGLYAASIAHIYQLLLIKKMQIDVSKALNPDWEKMGAAPSAVGGAEGGVDK